MAAFDLLFRMRRKASMVAFNDVLPSNFKLVVRNDEDTAWIPAVGVLIDEITNFELVLPTPLVPATLSTDLHVNVRVTQDWSGWSGLFIEEGDPDFVEYDEDGLPLPGGDVRLDNTKIKRWMRNNGVERLDDATDHPRSGRTDMKWFRWSKIGPQEWVDVTIDTPQLRRRVWL